MSFADPMVWREPNNHANDCYFCLIAPPSAGITTKKKWTIAYPNIPSAVLHSDQFRTAKDFPFRILRRNFPLIQTMRREANGLRVLRNLRRLMMIHTSATVRHLCHTFSPKQN